MKKLLILALVVTMPQLLECGCCTGGKCCGPCKPKKEKNRKTPKSERTAAQTKEIVKQAYSEVAQNSSCCSSNGCLSNGCSSGGCCGGGAELAKYIGYSDEEIESLADANLGLGCGNPIRLGDIPKGATVLDLGSGAGFDCFLAARKVGPTGKVIGVDMTPAMLEKARENAKKYKLDHIVEFRLGDIEKLPVENNSVDIVMSNCVINLAPKKTRVFNEAYRVLKPGGKMYVSDVVLTGNLTRAQKEDVKLLSACVAGAAHKTDYLRMLYEAGFEVTILGEDTQISKTWFDIELPISSLKFVANKK